MKMSFFSSRPFFLSTIRSGCLIILLLCGFQANAQETTELRPFNTIKIIGLIDVELIKSDVEKIEVRAFGNEEEKLKISQQHKTLKISTVKSLVMDDDLDINVKIYYTDLEALYVAAGADVESRDTLQLEAFYVRAGSGSEVYLEVDIDQLDAQAAEGAHLTLRGRARLLDAGANTGGILDGHRLTAESGKLRAGTGGEVSATVNSQLSARANTGGIIRYGGDPEISISRILGGEVRPLLRK